MVAAVQMDYVRQVQMEMMDDMLERGAYEGEYDEATGTRKERKYKRDPFLGENGEYAEDQPPSEDGDLSLIHISEPTRPY